MRRKVFRSGNSLAVTLPPEVQDLGIDAGTEVELEVREGAVLITPSEPVSHELVDWTKAFIERHRALLERLA